MSGNRRFVIAVGRRATKEYFDKAYMRCLAGIGYRDGLAQAWRSFSETPSEITPGELAPGERAPSGR